LEELAAAYGERQISLRDRLQARQPIEARIIRAERRLVRVNDTDALPSLIGNGEALGRAWDLNLDRQVAIITALLDHAVIGPGQPGARTLNRARATGLEAVARHYEQRSPPPARSDRCPAAPRPARPRPDQPP
jgi:hypothetical protein